MSEENTTNAAENEKCDVRVDGEVKETGRASFSGILLVVVLRLAAFAGIVWLAVEFSAFAALRVEFENIPSMEEIRSYRPKETTTIHDRRVTVFATLFLENRVVVPLDKISPFLADAVVAAEATTAPSRFAISSCVMPRSSRSRRMRPPNPRVS